MLDNRKTSKKNHSVLFGFIAVLTGMMLAVTTSAWISGVSQDRGRIFEKVKPVIPRGPEPVSLIEIKAVEKTINLGEEFEAGGDWLKGSRFRLRNDSGKEIIYISFELEFPETTSSGDVMIFPISLGHRPGGIVPNTVEPLSLKPDEKLTITIDDETYANLVKFIETRQSISSISKATARIYLIAFNDGTAWSGGEYFRQDPKNPKAYIPIKNN